MSKSDELLKKMNESLDIIINNTKELPEINYKMKELNDTLDEFVESLSVEKQINIKKDNEHSKLEKTSNKKVYFIVFGLIALLATIFMILVAKENIENNNPVTNLDNIRKPVIYFYNDSYLNVSVQLELNGELGTTIPKYNNGWEVEVHPNGGITDKNGIGYPYIYWDGVRNFDYDMSNGYCIKGEDTKEFLSVKIKELGLNDKEANDFLEYWVPYMEKNKYNIISFQTDCYIENAKLYITPKPDNLLRVYMAYEPSETYVEIEEQDIDNKEFKREGFTVVEWGGGLVGAEVVYK